MARRDAKNAAADRVGGRDHRAFAPARDRRGRRCRRDRGLPSRRASSWRGRSSGRWSRFSACWAGRWSPPTAAAPVLALGLALTRRFASEQALSWRLASAWAVGWSAVVVAGTAMLAAGVYFEIAWVALAAAGNLALLAFLVVRRWQPLRELRDRGRVGLEAAAGPGSHRLGPRDRALPGERGPAREPAPRRPGRARLPPGAAAVLELPARLVGASRQRSTGCSPPTPSSSGGTGSRWAASTPRGCSPSRSAWRRSLLLAGWLAEQRYDPLDRTRQRAVPGARADAAGVARHQQRRVASPLLPAARLARRPPLPRNPADPVRPS